MWWNCVENEQDRSGIYHVTTMEQKCHKYHTALALNIKMHYILMLMHSTSVWNNKVVTEKVNDNIDIIGFPLAYY